MPATKIRSVGEIGVVDLLRDAGFDDAILPFTKGLERSACIDEKIDFMRGELRSNVAIAIEIRGQKLCADGAAALAKGLGPGARAAGHDEDEARFIFEKPDEAAAERAIAAENENDFAVGHAMKRSAIAGSGR